MNPQKERSLSAASKPFAGSSYDLCSRPLDGNETALSARRRMKSGVIHRKAAVEAGGESVFRVQRDGSHERGRVVAVLTQQVGSKRQRRRQSIAKLARPMRLGVSAGQYG